MSKAFDILLVEDSVEDAFLTRTIIEDGNVPIDLSVTRNGADALAFLRRKAPFADAPPPDLILLDVNLPKKNGFEVLAEMRADETLRAIPVIMFTTSEAPQDIHSSYALGANCYITKPARLADFTATVRAIENFWLKAVRLPSPLSK